MLSLAHRWSVWRSSLWEKIMNRHEGLQQQSSTFAILLTGWGCCCREALALSLPLTIAACGAAGELMGWVIDGCTVNTEAHCRMKADYYQVSISNIKQHTVDNKRVPSPNHGAQTRAPAAPLVPGISAMPCEPAVCARSLNISLPARDSAAVRVVVFDSVCGAPLKSPRILQLRLFPRLSWLCQCRSS